MGWGKQGHGERKIGKTGIREQFTAKDSNVLNFGNKKVIKLYCTPPRAPL